MRIARVEWLGDPTSTALAENKLLQYTTAGRVSVPTPLTVVTSDPNVAREMLGDSFVLKPLGPSQVFDEGNARAVFAHEVRSDAPALAAMAGAPFLAQQRITAARHFRVVTVAQQAWVGALQVDDDMPLDWRRATASHRSFAAIGHPSLAGSATALASALNVGYSSQDWVEDNDGGYYFLDLNPAGQWLFLPFGDQVTAALAHWLVGRA